MLQDMWYKSDAMVGYKLFVDLQTTPLAQYSFVGAWGLSCETLGKINNHCIVMQYPQGLPSYTCLPQTQIGCINWEFTAIT